MTGKLDDVTRARLRRQAIAGDFLACELLAAHARLNVDRERVAPKAGGRRQPPGFAQAKGGRGVAT